jgi:hypothetical protein
MCDALHIKLSEIYLALNDSSATFGKEEYNLGKPGSISCLI